MTEEIKDLFKNVSPRERDVIRLLLGLDDGRPRTPDITSLDKLKICN